MTKPDGYRGIHGGRQGRPFSPYEATIKDIVVHPHLDMATLELDNKVDIEVDIACVLDPAGPTKGEMITYDNVSGELVFEKGLRLRRCAGVWKAVGFC